MASPLDAIAAARAALARAGIPPAEAAVDAEVLARHVLGWDRARLLAYGREPAPVHFDGAFNALLQRRSTREPVAMILGRREFWGLDFEVTRDVLVPRPETELLVEEALAFARIHACRLAIDVGTGSGCIAIAMAHELPELRIIAVDNSRSALDVASRNAVANGVADRITFVEGDMLDQVSAVADVIVSNPPYIPDADASELQRDVVQFEPHAALFGGIDGLDIIRRLFNEVPAHLAPEGRLIVEFGFGQDGQVRELATQTGWDAVRIREDLQGIPRTAVLARSRNGSGAGS